MPTQKHFDSLTDQARVYVPLAQQVQLNLDDNETLSLVNQLKAMETTLYMQKFPEVMYPSIMPVISDGPGYRKVSYRAITEYGVPKPASPNGVTPLVALSQKEYEMDVVPHKLAYRYTHHELQYSAKQDVPLDSTFALATKRQIDLFVDKLSIEGSTTTNQTGLLTNASSTITQYTVPNDGSGSSQLWSAKTGDLILRDINGLLNKTVSATLGIWEANVLLLPPSRLDKIKATPINTGSSTSIYKFLMESRPGLRIFGVNHLESVSTLSNQAVMVAYPMSLEVLTFKVPVPFMALPGVYTTDYDYNVTCYTDVAGVERKHPLAISYGQNI